jgi:general secretion pathway protein G
MVVRPQPFANRPPRRAAFTLLEVLIVVAIIVILAGVGGVYVFKAYEDAKEGIARTRAIALANAAQQFQIKYQRLPESLNELINPPEGGKPYVEPDTLMDPWGRPFQYDAAGPHSGGLKPDVFTTVPDTGAQIGNWSPGH